MINLSNWPEVERSMVTFFENIPEDHAASINALLERCGKMAESSTPAPETVENTVTENQ